MGYAEISEAVPGEIWVNSRLLKILFILDNMHGGISMKYQLRGIAMILFGILLAFVSIPAANELLWFAGLIVGVFGLILTFITE
ncbi:MAG: hypothetical protein LUH07_14460 [Lachnospiraceae bacterium]|nr:hypothetical protein [Lachnospiraceae bacterium]